MFEVRSDNNTAENIARKWIICPLDWFGLLTDNFMSANTSHKVADNGINDNGSDR